MKNKVILSILCFSLLLFFPISVYAASTYIQDLGYNSQDLDIDYYTYLDEPYQGGMNNAHYNWNHPDAPFGGSWIILTYSSSNKAYTEYSLGNYGGRYTSLIQNSNPYNKTTKFAIYYNTRLVPNSKSIEFITSVAGHEFGHALGLADDNRVDYSLMNTNRDRERYYIPWVTDCYGVYDNWNR